MATRIEEILKLPVEEKLEIVDQIWESLRVDDENAEIPEWRRIILQERLEKYKGNLTKGKSWEEVKRRLVKK